MPMKTRRGARAALPPPQAKMSMNTNRHYGFATFKEKNATFRGGEKNTKLQRELAMVNRNKVSNDEVKYRIDTLKSLKKLIQKIVTGAEAKRCPPGKPNCDVKIKGPYLVSKKTVQKLATIIRATPYDGATRGKTALDLVRNRVSAYQKRRNLIANVAADKLTLSRAVPNTSNKNPFSRAITSNNVERRKKRMIRAARAAATRQGQKM